MNVWRIQSPLLDLVKYCLATLLNLGLRFDYFFPKFPIYFYNFLSFVCSIVALIKFCFCLAIFCSVYAFFGSPLKFELIYILCKSMFILDFNSDISNMDGLKSKCLENMITFVVFLFDINFIS